VTGAATAVMKGKSKSAQVTNNQAWWSNHKYARKSVRQSTGWDPTKWDTIQDVIDQLESRCKEPEGKQAAVALMFEGGFRVGEILKTPLNPLKPPQSELENPHNMLPKYSGIRKSQLRFNVMFPKIDGKFLVTKDVFVEKKVIKQNKVKGPDGKMHFEIVKRMAPEKLFRTTAIKMSDRFVPIIQSYVKSLDADDFLFEFNRRLLYQEVRSIDKELFLHWFRGQRASQLVAEEGFNAFQLQMFFSWESDTLAKTYATASGATIAAMYSH